MSNQVYANNMEISCKSAAGKSICAFPDVCFTPPLTPATPPGVPIPYPNTGMASDCTSGSTTVKISGNEVMLKNKSYFKKSMGDEAGSAPKKGVLTSKNMGKVYFNAWSMDVMVEGENAVRNLDLTTHNHASWVGNSPPQAYLDRMAMASGLADCDSDRDKVEENCKHTDKPPCPDSSKLKAAEAGRKATKKNLTAQGLKGVALDRHPDRVAAKELVDKEYSDYANSFTGDSADAKCQQALKCFLSPEKPSKCCDKQTPHHLIPASSIVKEGTRAGKNGGKETVLKQFSNYESKNAPCVCVEGPNQYTATHRKAHNAWADKISSLPVVNADFEYPGAPTENASSITYGQAIEAAHHTMEKVAPGCSSKCTEAQLNSYHFGKKELSDDEKNTKLRRTMDDESLKSTPDLEF